METRTTTRHPWAWVPTLYFAQGIPYVVVMTVSVILYKRLDISNTQIALWTSWLYLPWVLKPLWSPFVDLLGTKRRWVVVLQGVIGAILACVALTIPTARFFQYTIALFWLMAFSSATHDIAADGFYMLGLTERQQAAFVGIRSTFYRVAMISGQGALVVFAGLIEDYSGNIRLAWSLTFGVLAVIFLGAFAWHALILPRPATDTPHRQAAGRLWADFFDVFAEFFRKERIGAIIAFLLLYRLAEAQLVKLISPFLLDTRAQGGLGLSTSQVGLAYGTVGVIALTIGGILGGVVVSRHGLRAWLWPMVFIIHLPDLMFVLLSQFQPSSLGLVTTAIAVEQFGYGFGFTAYMMFMILVAQGKHKTAHYALCTGFMALGMMLPGMYSGWLQETIGYRGFFLWVVISTLPGFLVATLVRIPEGFGRKEEAPPAPSGHCLECGYDLTGNVSGVCPECGKPVPAAAVK